MRFSATFLDVGSEDGAQVREGGVWLGGERVGQGQGNVSTSRNGSEERQGDKLTLLNRG